jgi:hypothetical protein
MLARMPSRLLLYTHNTGSQSLWKDTQRVKEVRRRATDDRDGFLDRRVLLDRLRWPRGVSLALGGGRSSERVSSSSE